MPKFTHSGEERQPLEQFELLKPGKYFFKVLDAEEGLVSGNGKTAGSEVLKVRIGINGKDKKLIAAWWEQLIFFHSIKWKLEDFSACVGLTPVSGVTAGQEIELTDRNTVGCIGIAQVEVNTYSKGGEEKRNNRVANWLPPEGEYPPDLELRKTVLAKKVKEDPFASQAQQENPFATPVKEELPSEAELEGGIGGVPF